MGKQVIDDVYVKAAYRLGQMKERERIVQWIENHRRKFELGDDLFIYRDSFNSEDLLEFINEKDLDGKED
jgi:hypothetical protein